MSYPFSLNVNAYVTVLGIWYCLQIVNINSLAVSAVYVGNKIKMDQNVTNWHTKCVCEHFYAMFQLIHLVIFSNIMSWV